MLLIVQTALDLVCIYALSSEDTDEAFTAPQFPPELTDRTFAFDSFDADATLINDENFFIPTPPISNSHNKLNGDAPSQKSRNKRLYDLVDKSREGNPRAFKRARTAKKHGKDTASLSPHPLKSLDASPPSPPLDLHHHRSSIRHVDLTTLKFPRTEALVHRFCAEIRAQWVSFVSACGINSYIPKASKGALAVYPPPLCSGLFCQQRDSGSCHDSSGRVTIRLRSCCRCDAVRERQRLQRKEVCLS